MVGTNTDIYHSSVVSLHLMLAVFLLDKLDGTKLFTEDIRNTYLDVYTIDAYTMAANHSKLFNTLLSLVPRVLLSIPGRGERHGVGSGRGEF